MHFSNLIIILIAIFEILQAENSNGKKGEIIASFPSLQNTTFLTFDDGPHRFITPLILDILKEKGVKATFYVVGLRAVEHSDIILRMFQEGHDVACHGWEHPKLVAMTNFEILESMNKTIHIIQKITGKLPISMRPPWGECTARINTLILNATSIHPILWSLDSEDWQRPRPSNMLKREVKEVKSGDILLHHDTNPTSLEVLSKLIDYIHKKGLHFQTLSYGLKYAQDIEYWTCWDVPGYTT